MLSRHRPQWHTHEPQELPVRVFSEFVVWEAVVGCAGGGSGVGGWAKACAGTHGWVERAAQACVAESRSFSEREVSRGGGHHVLKR